MQTNQQSRRMVGGSLRVVAPGTLLALLGVLVIPLALFAHAHLRRSEPTARARLSTSPRSIRLWFSERPQLAFTRVRLRAQDSSEMTIGPVVAIDNDAYGVAAPIPAPLPNGSYTVLWQTGGADGHPSRGSFQFVVDAVVSAQPPLVTAHPDSASTRGGHPIVRVQRTTEDAVRLDAWVATRWAEFIAILAVVGAVVLRTIVLPGVKRTSGVAPFDEESLSRISDAARRFAQAALVLALAAALARLYEEAALVLGPDTTIDSSSVLRVVRETSWGTGWLVGVGGIAVAALGLSIAKGSRAGWPIATIGALALAVAPALTGHAAATRPVALAVVADVLHVAGAGAWLGTLVVVVIVGIPALRAHRDLSPASVSVAALVRAYHPVALSAGTIVVLSGVLASWLRLPSVTSLWASAYGLVLLLKTALVVAVLLLGAFNWRRLLPHLGEDVAARTLRRTASAELSLAAVVLLVTALLVSLPTPEPPLEPAVAVPTPLDRIQH